MHWRNSNFQIKCFIVGSCHTADEAYHKLMELKEERDIAIANANANVFRQRAKALKAKSMLTSGDELEQLEGSAILAEMLAFEQQSKSVYDQAVRESAYIQSLIDEITPHRKYSHLPDYEAHQLAQEESWMLELLYRAENSILSIGTIPADQLSTMRMHPKWKEVIEPYISDLSMKVRSNTPYLIEKKQLLLEDK